MTIKTVEYINKWNSIHHKKYVPQAYNADLFGICIKQQDEEHFNNSNLLIRIVQTAFP